MNAAQADYSRLLGTILDIGVSMVESGAETHRIEDSLGRLTEAYGFRSCNIWAVPSNIQATVTTPSGEVLTQMRRILGAGVDFDQLEKLNALCRYACREVPSQQELEERLSDLRKSRGQSLPLRYLGGVLAAVGFGVFFSCDVPDAVTAALVALIITTMGNLLSRREGNPLILNFVIALISECVILLAVHLKLAHHAGAITIGVIMLLISGLGTTNGVRDLVHLDTFSGIMNISVSMAGAIGIALGIALPLFLLSEQEAHNVLGADPGKWLQLISCTVASIGFSLWFHIRGLKIILCAVGAFLTWAAYLQFNSLVPGLFGAAFFAATVGGLYSQIAARLMKAPATIFMTISVFPLIPGSSLYYMMYHIVTHDRVMAEKNAAELVMVCFGIVMGFLAVEVLSRYLWPEKKPSRSA